MKKFVLGAVVAIALAVPTTSVIAQTHSEDQYRTILIQLIISLQKQIALLTSGQTQQTSSNVTDRCPNIDGIQSSVPTGLIYSRTFDKCVTERELDELEGESSRNERIFRVCEQAEDNLSEARRSFLSQVDFVDSLKTGVKKNGGPSKYSVDEVERMMTDLRPDPYREKYWSDEENYLINVISGIRKAESKRDDLQRELVRVESEAKEECN